MEFAPALAAVSDSIPWDEAVDRAIRKSNLRSALTRAIRSLRGTPQSSAYPDSLGDRMLCCLIALGAWNFANHGPFVTRGDELLAEFSAAA